MNEMSNIKERSQDRVLVLKVKDGDKAKDSAGLIDKRLFTGENNLHVVMDRENLLWSFKYDRGGLPEPLKQKFTNFFRAYEFAKGYFDTRGIQIEKVID